MTSATAALAGFHDYEPETEGFGAGLVAGLERPRKEIPCKFFYDSVGSALFERICELPEYYPTRTETALLEAHRGEIAAELGDHRHLVELGSGSAQKVRILLQAMRPAAYTAVDISREHLLRSTAALAADHPGLEVHAVCADYTRNFVLPRPASKPDAVPVAFFPGSTVGNFAPADAEIFLRRIAALIRGGDLLIGVDLKKDAAILNAAYNDKDGVTAAFNLNLLARANRELGADFDLAAFAHRAFYDEAEGRIEMHLVSLARQTVRIGDHRIAFADGETIHTENSYKYTVAEFQALAGRAGFAASHVWVDGDDLFSIHHMRAR